MDQAEPRSVDEKAFGDLALRLWAALITSALGIHSMDKIYLKSRRKGGPINSDLIELAKHAMKIWDGITRRLADAPEIAIAKLPREKSTLKENAMLTPEEEADIENRFEHFQMTVNEFTYKAIQQFGQEHKDLIRSTVQQFIDDCGDGVPTDFAFDRVLVAIAKKTGQG